jgi:hypothetical protein
MMRIKALILLSECTSTYHTNTLANATRRGFQSIGAYHAPASNGIAVSGALKSR